MIRLVLHIVSFCLLGTLTLPAFAQRTSRLGNDPVLFEDDQSYYYLDQTFQPLVNVANDTAASPGYPGVAPTRGTGFDTRATLALTYQAKWIIGFSYDAYSLAGKRDVVSYGQDALAQSTTRHEWGPTVGWVKDNWRMTLTYFIDGASRVSNRTNNSASDTSNVVVKNRKMDGLQVALAYTFPLMGRAYFGPSLVYRAVNYHQQARANVFNTADSYDFRPLYRALVNAALTPMLSVSLRF